MASRIPVSISFSSIANFLGTIGVIGSLVFVGLELRQSHQIALAGQIQARSELIAQAILAPLEGQSEAIKIWSRPNKEPFLSEEQELLWGQITRFRAVSLDNVWQQYTLGLMSEDSWSQAENRGKNLWIDCEQRLYAIGPFTDSLEVYARANWSDEECQHEG
ncbi:MAG: hypothetical protein ACPGO2_05365 [Pseudohongiellaceae bacterium]|jgi:hypothetical protein